MDPAIDIFADTVHQLRLIKSEQQGAAQPQHELCHFGMHVADFTNLPGLEHFCGQPADGLVISDDGFLLKRLHHHATMPFVLIPVHA